MSKVDVSALGEPSRVVEKEGDIVKFWEWPGGYYMQGPAGVFSIRGADSRDQIYVHEWLGVLNISKALKLIAEANREGSSAYEVPISPALIEHISHVDIDMARVLSMSEQRRDDPVIFVQANNGAQLIDGHHRLKRRIIDRLEVVYSYILPTETIELIRIRWSKWHGGKWLPWDVFNDRLETSGEQTRDPSLT